MLAFQFQFAPLKNIYYFNADKINSEQIFFVLSLVQVLIWSNYNSGILIPTIAQNGQQYTVKQSSHMDPFLVIIKIIFFNLTCSKLKK